MRRETQALTLSLVDDTYYYIELKEDVEFDVPDLLDLIEAEKEICNKVMPVLVICSTTVSASGDFVRYLAKNENNPLSKADAFVLKSVAQQLLAHFYKLFITPERPIAFFKKKEDALKWLEQFFDH